MISAYYVWGIMRTAVFNGRRRGRGRGRGLDKIAQYDLSVIFTNIAGLNSHLTNSEVFNII